MNNPTVSRIKALAKYLQDFKQRLCDTIPVKHKHHEQEYLNFLKREIKRTEAKIEQLNRENV